MNSTTNQQQHVTIHQLSIIQKLLIYIYHEHENLSSTTQLSSNSPTQTYH